MKICYVFPKLSRKCWNLWIKFAMGYQLCLTLHDADMGENLNKIACILSSDITTAVWVIWYRLTVLLLLMGYCWLQFYLWKICVPISPVRFCWEVKCTLLVLKWKEGNGPIHIWVTKKETSNMTWVMERSQVSEFTQALTSAQWTWHDYFVITYYGWCC